MIDVLCVTTGTRKPQGLQYVPDDYRYLTDSREGWAEAANALLDVSENDVLFLDDDIELRPETFALFEIVRPYADILGFTLLAPHPHSTDYYVQSAGHVLVPVSDAVMLCPQQKPMQLFTPQYVAHVTASCFWIRKEVIQAGVRFPVWQGAHYEDVAFTYQAWLQGFKVAYCPGAVLHHTSAQAGVGATKGADEAFHSKRQTNADALALWEREHGVLQACLDGRIPVGSHPVFGKGATSD